VLGRLPRKYQLTIWFAGLLTFTALGSWLVLRTDIPLVWPSGAALGAVLGAVAVAFFVHAIGSSPRSVEVHDKRSVVRHR
jgi:hypothetical protein